ncbi:DUF7331 family protein [Halovenus halobia]
MKKQPQDNDTGEEPEYQAVEAGDGEFVIYDRSKKTAWIQSNHTVDVQQ